MAITADTLRFYASERMTDNADGGGQMSGTEIVSGQENQIFDDISDVDRAAGDVSIRKIYAAVTSADTDKYLDAGVVIFRAPQDPAASVLAFSTGSFYDERAALKARLEQTITRGARWNGYLWGQHLIGQRAVVLWQTVYNELPAVGQRLDLVQLAAGEQSYNQFLWVTRTIDNIRIRTDDRGQYEVREVVCEIAEPLLYDFNGNEPTRLDPAIGGDMALLYNTRYNAEAVPLFGVRPLVEAAEPGDFTCRIDSLYSPIIPTAFTETALPDVTPGGDSPALVGGNTGTISFSTSLQVIKPDASLFCGSGILPGTLSISCSSSLIQDNNGVAKIGELAVGTVDYSNGILRWNSACPDFGAAGKTVTFTPAVSALDVVETAAQRVTLENRGYVWVITLSPIPLPGSLRVSYRVNNAWYVISDQGGGVIRGVDSSYGSGSLNFGTGTVTISTGALPDVDSEIIYAWGTPARYTIRGGGVALTAPVVSGQTAHGGVAPNSVTVTWTVGQDTFSLTDADGDGVLTGTGGEGTIRYATGDWTVWPEFLPAGGTEFSIEYDWGAPIEETFAHPIREPDGTLALTLADDDLKPGTVEVEWNLLVLDYEAALSVEVEFIPPITRPFDPIKIVRDDGNNVLTVSGGTDGAVNYAAGTVSFLPDVTINLPKPLYSPKLIGTSVAPVTGGGTVIVNVYRTTFDGFEYIPAGAMYPADETGYVKVRYRVIGGDTTATETVTLNTLMLDITKGYGETVVPGSTRFTLGYSTYVESAGQIYRDPGPDTGAGTLSGSLDPISGRVLLSSWTSPGANAVALQSLVTCMDAKPMEEVVFRTPTAPIKSGTLQLRWTTLDGIAKSKTVDGTGLLEDADCTIRVDSQLGVVRARFGQWKVDANLTPEEKLEIWYDPDSRIDFNGTLKIWKPRPALASSIIYNAVASTVLPPDSNLLGIDAARLPPDGRALIFNTGRLCLTHHTDTIELQSLSPTQQIDCQRVRLYRVAFDDSTGLRFPASFYTVDRETGVVTMAADLNLTGYTAPYTLSHTVADLARLVSTDINGTLAFNKALSHDYPADDSKVSGMLYAGTLQARYSNLFAQSTWTGEWSDEVIGSEPLSQYNDTLYPIQVTNVGAYTDRILVKFTSQTAFQVIGENLGLIAVGNTSEDCSPVNTLTSETYFTIDCRGWGTGWSTGNCVRFNLIGACYPVTLIRAIQPSDPSGLDIDSVELLFIGNVDA